MSKIKQCGQVYGGDKNNPLAGRVFDIRGVAPTMCCGFGWGGARLIKDERMSETKRKVRIRKLTETEVFRLMDVDEKYIERMRNSGVSRTKLYFAAGNSIVVSCMEHIFENLFYPKEELARQDANGQLSLF